MKLSDENLQQALEKLNANIRSGHNMANDHKEQNDIESYARTLKDVADLELIAFYVKEGREKDAQRVLERTDTEIRESVGQHFYNHIYA